MNCTTCHIMKVAATKLAEHLTYVYSRPLRRRNLMDFNSGVIALFFGASIKILFFNNLAKSKFLLTYPIMTLLVLLGLLISANRRGHVTWVHYLIAFIFTYSFGFALFAYGDNESGVYMFSLVYPVLGIYIFKLIWGNLLIATELLTCYLANEYINASPADDTTFVIFISMYIVFWIFSNVIETMKDFMENKLMQQQKKLAYYANYDQQTGLFNRRHLYEVLKEMDKNQELQETYSLTILDIDNFKSINDIYGHNNGDEVLVETANRILKNTRDQDICCRWGGEEFLILAKVDGVVASQSVAQRICDAIGETTFTLSDGTTLSVTVSVGSIYTRLSSDTLNNLVRIADHNMYHAKGNGKNQIHFSVEL